MLQNTAGSFRLFRAFGVDVFIHWSWFVVAYIQFMYVGRFSDPVWHFAVYGSLFGIVLLHEFGHALACRSVGGEALKIVLWPLGGIAYVRPPQRPGAVLWSIAAGPLVNVALVPVIMLAMWLVGDGEGRLQSYVQMLMLINTVLLVFNLLPIYPLDGGQIVQALLWFKVGRTKSLLWSAWFGLGCAVVIGVLVAVAGDLWLLVMAFFIGFQSWRGIQIARMMAAYEQQTEPWQR